MFCSLYNATSAWCHPRLQKSKARHHQTVWFYQRWYRHCWPKDEQVLMQNSIKSMDNGKLLLHFGYHKVQRHYSVRSEASEKSAQDKFLQCWRELVLSLVRPQIAARPTIGLTSNLRSKMSDFLGGMLTVLPTIPLLVMFPQMVTPRSAAGSACLKFKVKVTSPIRINFQK